MFCENFIKWETYTTIHGPKVSCILQIHNASFSLTVLVSYNFYNEESQARELKQHTFILWQWWRSISKIKMTAGFIPFKTCRRESFLVSTSFWCLPAILVGPCPVLIFASIFMWSLPLCVCTWSTWATLVHLSYPNSGPGPPELPK